MLNIKKLIGGGNSKNSLIGDTPNTGLKQAGTLISFVTLVCLSAFLMSMTPSVSPEGGEKTHKVKKKKEKKPKKDKKDKKQEQTEQQTDDQTDEQTAQPFEVKEETGDPQQL